MTGQQIRRIVLEQAMRAHVGHIGSALSVADLLAVLYGRVLRAEHPADPERDRFVLSKGHAALALYAALQLRGWLSAEELNRYGGDHTLLGVHPEWQLPGVDFATGSLGQGVALAAGAALAARLQHSPRRAFALVSDGECNEGSLWETVMFAAHQKLANLIVLVDLNGQQAFGYTDEVLSLTPMAPRWQAFGWDVHEVDGHHEQALAETIATLDTRTGPPHVLLARTVFGKGVSYMESQIKWHYWPMSESEYAQALAEIGALS
jgi:transketolase